MLLNLRGDGLRSSVRPLDDHPPSGFGEGVLDRDIGGVGDGVPAMGVRDGVKARGLSPQDAPDVVFLAAAGSCRLGVGRLFPEGRRRGCTVPSPGVARLRRWACGSRIDLSMRLQGNRKLTSASHGDQRGRVQREPAVVHRQVRPVQDGRA